MTSHSLLFLPFSGHPSHQDVHPIPLPQCHNIRHARQKITAVLSASNIHLAPGLMS